MYYIKRWPNIKFSDRIIINGDTIEVRDEIDNSKVLNDLNINPMEIYKCMSFNRSKSLIESAACEQLSFVTPKLWVDPFEYFLYEGKALKTKYNKRLYCFSASFMRSESEEALWKTYAGEKEKIHNIWRINFINFLNTIDKYAKAKRNVTFFVAPINYSKSKDEIIDLSKQGCNSLDDYINRLIFKRKAFKSDNEIRIFACVDFYSNNDDIYNVDANLTDGSKNDMIIKSVIMEPFPPYKNIYSDPYGYAVKQHFRNLDMRDYYKKKKIKVEESRLYLVKKIDNRTLKNRISKIASNI